MCMMGILNACANEYTVSMVSIVLSLPLKFLIFFFENIISAQEILNKLLLREQSSVGKGQFARR